MENKSILLILKKYSILIFIAGFFSCTSTIIPTSISISIYNDSDATIGISVNPYIFKKSQYEHHTFILKPHSFYQLNTFLNTKEYPTLDVATIYSLYDTSSLLFDNINYIVSRELPKQLTDVEVIYNSAWSYKFSCNDTICNKNYTIHISNRLLNLTSTDFSMLTKFKDYYNK